MIKRSAGLREQVISNNKIKKTAGLLDNLNKN